jgi:hypothetical protein
MGHREKRERRERREKRERVRSETGETGGRARRGETEDKGQKTEDRRQQAASQIVNLSNSQMVINRLNDDLTI